MTRANRRLTTSGLQAIIDTFNRSILKMVASSLHDASIAVIGNGPSLRGFDFARFVDVHTLGMNAAYRYWREIDWRPTHYACLDDALIDTHIAEICSLIEEGRIDSFFLSGRALELRPKLAHQERVRFLDEFVPHWNRVRGANFGLQLLRETAFITDFPDLLTTGSYAVRYAAMLGYSNIGLFGIDLEYESIPGTESLGENRLVMTETPLSNPNYFFDGYQQKGDLFHVPNPEAHQGELHIEAFRAVRDDFTKNGVRCRVTNSNPQSRLSHDAILPFESEAVFLDEPGLSAVIIPVTAGEVGQLIANLAHFNKPSGAPWLGTRPKTLPTLLIVFNNDDAAKYQSAIIKAFGSLANVNESFCRLEFVKLGLVGDADVYQKSNEGRAGTQGRRAGPNNLFFGAMSVASRFLGSVLYMETDCIPVRPGWLGEACRVARRSPSTWITGSIYRGRDPLGPRETRHINGNAIYAAGDTGFHAFLNDEWKTHLEKFRSERPELPFDCVIEDMFQRVDSKMGGQDEFWPRIQNLAHRFGYSSFIVNLAGSNLPDNDFRNLVSEAVRTSPDCYIIHSRQLAELYKNAIESGAPTDFRKVLDRIGCIESSNANGVSREGKRASRSGAANKIRSGLKAIVERVSKL